jgi:hypothetical protein
MKIRLSTISKAWYVKVSLLARESCQLFLDMPDWRVMNRLSKKTHMLLPIALSFVEGCARSSRSDVLKLGIVEGWNDGLMGSKPNIPIFQYSNTPLRTHASEISLTSR